jgi:hypothetical protein
LVHCEGGENFYELGFYMLRYSNRTLESIAKEHADYTYEGVLELAKYLESWMSNEHNGRQFVRTYNDMKKDKCTPHQIAIALLGHAYDWLAYGN